MKNQELKGKEIKTQYCHFGIGHSCRCRFTGKFTKDFTTVPPIQKKKLPEKLKVGDKYERKRID